MILDPHIVFISNKRGNMPPIRVIILELSFILLNKIKIILSVLCDYCHCNQCYGTAAILAEQRLKEHRELERVYVDNSTSTGMKYI